MEPFAVFDAISLPDKVDVVDLRARRVVGHGGCRAAGERDRVLEVGGGA